MRTIQQLTRQLPQQGKLEWIGLRPEKRMPLHVVQEAEVIADQGLKGDRAAIKSGGKRQVTLLQSEHLPAVSSYLGQQDVVPEMLRRNLVVSGINLLALKNRQFYVGQALMEYTGTCAPCSRMEEVLGAGGYNAMRGHGGITARVIIGSIIRLGDTVYAA